MAQINFKEFTQYADSFHNMHMNFNNWLSNFLLEQAQRVITNTVEVAPVGETGDLRASWNIGNVVSNGINLEVEILNGMEYASHVEYGHAKVGLSGQVGPGDEGWVQGRYMLTISMNEIHEQMPLRFNKEFKNFLREYGVV